jgi:hypothetical protein
MLCYWKERNHIPAKSKHFCQKHRETVHVVYDALTAVVVKSSTFWGIIVCSPLKVTRRFGEACCLHLQDQGISQARNQHKFLCLLSVKRKLCEKQTTFRRLCFPPDFYGYLCSILFYSEDGSSAFLRNVWELLDYMSLYPRRHYSSCFLLVVIQVVRIVLHAY